MIHSTDNAFASRVPSMTRLAAACGLACAVSLLGACHPGGNGRGNAMDLLGSSASVRTGDSQLQTKVDGTRTSTRLRASTAQTKEAASGDKFVVLDVSVRNPDTQPHVFSEGKLVAVNGAGEHTFATPVDMLADEFLTLQVLPPSASVHGKIAYEVPRNLAGVLYWVPGDSSQRILLHLDAVTTVADDAKSLAVTRHARAAVPVVAAATAAPAHGSKSARPALLGAEVLRNGRGSVVTSSTQTTPTITTEALATRDETARTLACQSLVSRNDPTEKARYIGFFKRECSGYVLPSAWSTQQVATIAGAGAPTWPPRPGPAFDCSQAWTRAEHLICEDAVLSLMDWELNRAFAKARTSVADPDALQRDEDEWRHRVRDACDSSRCIESVYNQRTATLEAISRSQ